MREIEFRAWDKNLMEMVRIISLNFRHECGYILGNHPDSIKLGRDDTYMLDKADAELMQFTGEVDHLGTKIFEGDIVFIDSLMITGEIVMDCFAWKIKHGHEYEWVCDYHEDLQVIGNIYQHPNLLDCPK